MTSVAPAAFAASPAIGLVCRECGAQSPLAPVHVCSNCGFEEPVFGSGGGERMAAEYDVELLGQLPLDRAIREQTDGGTPSVLADPETPVAAAYLRTARRLAARLALRGRDYSHRFPNIVVEDT